MGITLHQAQAAVKAAHEKASELELNMNIAVVDAGGNLMAFARMEGAWLGSSDIASKKARTARYFDMPTGALGKMSQPGEPLYGIEVTNGGLVSFPGGELLLDAGGTIVGASGASGSTVDDDDQVAKAGVKALTAM